MARTSRTAGRSAGRAWACRSRGLSYQLCSPECLEGAFVLGTHHAPSTLSQRVLRIASHTRSFRGSAIVPTILSFLSRALKRCLPVYTRVFLKGASFGTSRRERTPKQPHSPKYVEKVHYGKSRWRILYSAGPMLIGVRWTICRRKQVRGRQNLELRTFRRAERSYRPKNSLAAGLIISGLHIGSNVSWAFTVSTPSMDSVSVSTCSWIKSPTGHIGLVRLKVTST